MESEQVKRLVPTFYHGYVENDEVPSPKTNFFSCLCSMMVGREERGLLVIGDLSDAFQHQDKKAIPSVDRAGLILRSVAHLHGAWWKLLNGKKKKHMHQWV